MNLEGNRFFMFASISLSNFVNLNIDADVFQGMLMGVDCLETPMDD